jgi:aspartyl-tRNA(Asn)/glutamyl-tRNA(Gln) amidotransferase subunit A
MTTLQSGHAVVNVVARAMETARVCGAFVSLRSKAALEEAQAMEAEPRRGPLHGVPIAIKDNIDVTGMWTRNGTPALGHHRAERDAALVARLRASGAIVIGKTRMHELAWGMITPGSDNPRLPGHVTGGSSGGSAAAVAAGAVPLALGTDTGGSIRNPAALCGVLGLKTTPGSPLLAGVSPLAPTQDSVGVLAAHARDCRAALAALDLSEPDRRPRRIGVLTDRWAQRVEPEVAAAVDRGIERLQAAGVEVTEVLLRYAELAPAVSYVTILVEAARIWCADEPPPTGTVGQEVLGQLLLGCRVTEADYARANQVRATVVTELRRALADMDALMLASCPVGPAPAGTREVHCSGRTIPIEAAHTALTGLASAAGLPAISVPDNVASFPIGVQFVSHSTAILCSLADMLDESDR